LGRARVSDRERKALPPRNRRKLEPIGDWSGDRLQSTPARVATSEQSSVPMVPRGQRSRGGGSDPG